MIKFIIGVIALTTISIFPVTNAMGAVESIGSSIVGIAGYGSFRSLGVETIEKISKAIKYECLVNREAKLLTQIDCIAFSDEHIYRLCSAVCSKGKNVIIGEETHGFVALKKVTK